MVSLRRREFSSAMSFKSSIISLASCVRICAQEKLLELSPGSELDSHR